MTRKTGCTSKAAPEVPTQAHPDGNSMIGAGNILSLESGRDTTVIAANLNGRTV